MSILERFPPTPMKNPIPRLNVPVGERLSGLTECSSTAGTAGE